MWTKTVAVIMIWICFVGIFLSGIYLMKNDEIITSNNYYETNNYIREFSRMIHNSVEYHLKLKNEENIKASDLDSEEAILADQLNRYETIVERIGDAVNFRYYIHNPTTGEIFTNLKSDETIALLKKQSTFVQIGKTISEYRTLYYADDIIKMLSDSNHMVYAAVIEPLKEGDVFYQGYRAYWEIKDNIFYIFIVLIISLILLIISSIYLVIVAGRREKDGDIVLTFVDKIHTDVQTLFVLIAAFISLVLLSRIIDHTYISTFILIAAAIILSVDAFIGITYILSIVRQIKTKQVLKNTLLIKLFNFIKELLYICFNGKLFKASLILALLGYGAANVVISFFFLSTLRQGGVIFLFSSFLLLAFNIAIVYFCVKSLMSLTYIMETTKEISMGNINYNLDNKEITITFQGLAQDIQRIQQGLKRAVEEAVKVERMKADLITNVSHDLKTPLTSIVSYVDLLKNEKLNNEKVNGYINILEEKSERLKKLIEDLLEASKASSGNIAVHTEKVDLHELIMQACGEYEGKIKNTSLDIRMNDTDKKIAVRADGKHMWRIVENLISNALKYSMANSRVYINIFINEPYGVVTIKNVSEVSLDISPEQLTERFVRGDESRSTEGSGLGLSIAQSLTHIQGGRFKIEIDGDLFKVTVEMPLWRDM